jgi:hypothetical protein
MVGDWPERDVVGGRSLGMKTVFARYGDTFGTVESGADYDIDDVHELVAIVDRLNAAGHAPGQPTQARPGDVARPAVPGALDTRTGSGPEAGAPGGETTPGGRTHG